MLIHPSISNPICNSVIIKSTFLRLIVKIKKIKNCSLMLSRNMGVKIWGMEEASSAVKKPAGDVPKIFYISAFFMTHENFT